ncbi:hypothetical protein DSOL_5306 [Desulfosporosinus metallidurans]|uniref:Uncharacterized protein n=1 Tax=Desulfosporosinus metallidurans TaxID=1888891 RepID=A0A1Q8QDU6_9FIRM|nr:hypothetical protein DSOL_5306 [Desulfosporosinus metallidurans]
MVIVSNYALIENPQTGSFLFGVQNPSLVLVAVINSSLLGVGKENLKIVMGKPRC